MVTSLSYDYRFWQWTLDRFENYSNAHNCPTNRSSFHLRWKNSVEAIYNEKLSTSTQTLDTDRVHGERLVFDMLIDEGRRHELVRMVIATGNTVYTFDHPRAGVRYKLEPLRKHSTNYCCDPTSVMS